MTSPCNPYAKNTDSQFVGKTWLVGAAMKARGKGAGAIGEAKT